MDDLDLGETIRGFQPGQRMFGRFILGRMLGKGGMGVVWLAHDEKLGEDVALKFVAESMTHDAAAIDDLKAETRKARALAHPHIVHVHEFWEDAHAAAVSMEFVDGRNLSQLRVERPGKVFSPEELRPWVQQMGEALTYAHEKARLVHRDLKPANLMIDARGDVKIADFGISAAISESTTRVSRVASSGFTPAYASPQQLLGKRPTAVDDVYSLGATLYELLTGKPPFFRGDLRAQVEREIPVSLTERRNELGHTGAPIPLAWEETIAACLAKEPAQRPQSVREVVERLGRVGEATAQAPRPEQRAERGVTLAKPILPAPKITARKLVVVGLALVGFFFLMVGYHLFTLSPLPPPPVVVRPYVQNQKPAPPHAPVAAITKAQQDVDLTPSATAEMLARKKTLAVDGGAPPRQLTASDESVSAAPEVSQAFKTFVANARLSGVIGGTPVKILLNGRMAREGDVVESSLGITFANLDYERKLIVFRDKTGAVVTRKY